MNRPLLRTITRVAPIDWTNVRPVYKKLQDDFHLLVAPFGVEVSPTRNLHLSHLIATIDSLDRNLDNLDAASERTEFAEALIAYLDGSTATMETSLATDEVVRRTGSMKAVIVAADVQREFCATAKQILIHTEAKRLATDAREMVEQMRIEWRLTGHLTILLLGKASTSAFDRFFFLLCEAMTAIDMIQDAVDDYRTGQISVRPCPALYLRLTAEFLMPLPKLIWLFPKRTNMMKYAFGFLREVYFGSGGIR